MPKIYCTADLNRLPNKAARDRQDRAIALCCFLAYLVLMAVAGWLQ